MHKNAQNLLRLLCKRCAKVRKKTLRENYANFAHQIWSFCGNPSRECCSAGGKSICIFKMELLENIFLWKYRRKNNEIR